MRALFFALVLNALPAYAAPLKFCVATAAHQIEGGNDQNDWWDWEQAPGKIRGGERSGAAADHWNRVASDTALIAALGARQYRFSVEWARIEPRPGEIDAAAVAHYRREVQGLVALGIEPFVTLHHFTLPRWVRALGGWEWPGAPEAFERFARVVYRDVAPGARDWVTINEPMVHLLGGYGSGQTPPGIADLKQIERPLVGLVRAHARAYRALHDEAARLDRPVRVGIAHHLRVFDPASAYNPIEAYLAPKLDQAFNWSFGEACDTGRLAVSLPFVVSIAEDIPEARDTQDFIGVNYYTRDRVSLSASSPLWLKFNPTPGAQLNDLGWEIYPEGFYRVLRETARRFPGKPVLITENGLADATDSRRAEFIVQHLMQLERAAREGVPIESYCHWSLMDNFEWVEGFGPRFGLFEVDYATQRRTPRGSARVFMELARDYARRGR
jgi:beta-glucosidase